MSHTLPSITDEARNRRVRDIRIKLDLHKQVMAAGNQLLGCSCGWSTPNGMSGFSSHRDHLAAELERVTR